jgi:hypothetical protein
MVLEQFARLVPTSVQPRHHGADRAARDLGNLSVCEALDIGEVDGEPGVRDRFVGSQDQFP